MEEAERLCKRVAIMDAGKILAIGGVDALVAEHGGRARVEARVSSAADHELARRLASDFDGEFDDECLRIAVDDPLQAIAELGKAGLGISRLRVDILIGKGLACFIAGWVASATLLGIGVLLLGVGVDQPIMLAVAISAAAACFTGFMMLISVIGKTESAVAGGSWILMMPLAMLGGGMIPLIAMPQWMLTLSNISPFKWAVIAIEGAVWRGFTWGQMVMPIGILLAVAVALFAAGVLIMRAREA